MFGSNRLLEEMKKEITADIELLSAPKQLRLSRQSCASQKPQDAQLKSTSQRQGGHRQA